MGRSVAVALALAIRLGVTLVAFVGLSRIYSPEMYGSFRRTWLILTVASVVSRAGMPGVLSRFLPTMRTRRVRIQTLSVCIGIMLGIGVLSSLVVRCMSQTIATWIGDPLLATAIAAGAWMIPGIALLNQSVSLLSSAELYGYSTIANAVLGGTFLSILMHCAWQGYPLADTLLAVSLGLLVAGAAVVAATLYLIGDSQGESDQAPSLKSMLGYGAQVWLGDCIGEGSRALPRSLASALSSAREFAVFSNGAVGNPLLDIVFMAIANVMVPGLARAKDQGSEALERILRGAAGATGFLTFPVCLFSLSKASTIMTFVYGPHYGAGAFVFGCFSLIPLLRMIAIHETLIAMGLARQNTILNIISVLTVGVGAYAGCTLGGIPGLSVGLLVAMLVNQLFGLVMLVRYSSIRVGRLMPWSFLARVLAISVFSMVSLMALNQVWKPSLLSELSPFMDLLVSGVVFLGFSLFAGCLCKIQKHVDWPFGSLLAGTRLRFR